MRLWNKKPHRFYKTCEVLDDEEGECLTVLRLLRGDQHGLLFFALL